MKINLGYVAIALKLENASPNKTITLKSLEKLEKHKWRGTLLALAKKNIENTCRIIKYNNAYGIKLYRLTSKLVPLATHEEVIKIWNFKEDLKDDFKILGDTIKKYNIRVSAHPDHFVLLNSPREDVIKTSIKDLEYHNAMYNLMGLSSEAKLVIHVGGGYGKKEEAIDRFYKGFHILSSEIKKRIIIENDDKIYNVEDVLKICKNINVPMVLDVHHDYCNPSSKDLSYYLEEIYTTWNKESIIPKIHYSSPKSEKEIRAHSEYINSHNFLSFMDLFYSRVNKDLDVMLEAKKKDESLFSLIEEVKNNSSVELLNGGSFLYEEKSD